MAHAPHTQGLLPPKYISLSPLSLYRAARVPVDCPVRAAVDNLNPLVDDKFGAVLEDLDRDKDGYATFEELEVELRQEHRELAPEPPKHPSALPSRTGFGEAGEQDGRRTSCFLPMPTDA